MKKLLAILLAALMALTGALALAEGGDIAGASQFPGLTATGTCTVDREALADLLTALNLQDYAGLADTVAAVVSEAGERLYVGEAGLEYVLSLKGSDILNLVAEPTEDGIALASNLVPSYTLTASNETLTQLLQKLAEKLGFNLDDADLESLIEAASAYFGEFIGKCASAVSLGDPEQGEYEVNGVTYNTMVPVNVDIAAINEASETLVKKLNEDETVQAVLKKLQGAGVNVSLDEDEAGNPEAVPALDMQAYMNVDEDGIPGDTVDVVFTVTAPGEEQPATTGDVLVQGSAVTVSLDFVSADSQLTVALLPGEGGSQLRVDANIQGLYVGLDERDAISDSAWTVDADLYVVDTERPLISEHCDIISGGALTLSATGEGKTVLAVEDLMGEGADDAIGNLFSDLISNGLGSVVSGAMAAMPEEIGSLAGGFLGGGMSADEAPAA